MPIGQERSELQADFESCSPTEKRYVKANFAVFCASLALLALGVSFLALPRCQARQASGEDFKDACRIGLGFMATAAVPMAASMPVTIIACIGGFFSCKKNQEADPARSLLRGNIQYP